MTDPSHTPDTSKKVGRPQIREIFLRNGARIEPDRDDLPDWVYESVFELLDSAIQQAGPAIQYVAPTVQGEPEETINAVISLVEDAAAAHLNSEFRSCLSKIRKLLYAAPQTAGQQPVCPTCCGRGWDMDCQNQFRPATCPDCAGSGKAEHSITVQEADSAAPDVTQLVEALEKIAAFQPKDILCGSGWKEWNRAGEYAASIARDALAAHRKQGGSND